LTSLALLDTIKRYNSLSKSYAAIKIALGFYNN
jgi:hypothetical protein